MTSYNVHLPVQRILVLVVTTSSQVHGKESLEQLGLTSEVGKALKLSAKSTIGDKWKEHDI